MVFAALNFGLLGLAWLAERSGGTGATVVAVLLGPAVNGLIGLIGLTLAGSVGRTHGTSSRESYLFCAIGLPVAAVIGDFAVSLGMGWFGC